MSTIEQNSRCEKVVIRFSDEVVKGYIEAHTWGSIEELLANAPSGLPTSLRVRRVGHQAYEELWMDHAKAVFFVSNFDGDIQHRDLRFSTRAPIVHGVWIRVEFLDGEIMEGIVHNTIHYLVNQGFFMHPSDPDSNNRLVYVFKNQLKDYRVLGLRKLSF